MGDILGVARRSANSFQGWLDDSDPSLARRVAQTAEQTGVSPTGYVRAAVADFSRFASEEDWATLVSAMRESPDPGNDCLRAMIDWRLTVKGCGEHSHANNEPKGAADERSDAG